MALSWPVEARVTQQFGTNPNSIQPNGHTGIDYGVPVGTPIFSADSGTVVFADWAWKLAANNPWWIAPKFAGICVVINHNDGFLTLYAHLSETDLNAGQFVEKGVKIGLSGSTGLSTGPHLHFEVLGWPLKPYNGFYGRLNPNAHCGGFAKAQPVEANQRVVGSTGAKERTGASTSSAEGKVYGHGDVLTFKGYVRGESVNGTDLWFVGAFSGTFFSASAFDDGGVSGLQDLTPPAAPVALGVGQRKAASVIKYRKGASTSATIVQEYAAGEILNFSHWTRGEDVRGNNVWFKGSISGGYAWSGGFEDGSTNGLTEEATSAPAPAPSAAVGSYTFTPDFDFVEVIPAALPNFMFGNFPQDQDTVAIHQFGTLGVDTVKSTINTFTHPALERVASAHFVVSGKRIIQMVSLKDRAYHAGTVGNNYVGIETDPAQDADTIESTKKLLAALRDKYGKELKKTLHKNIPGNSTNCGASITLSKYDLATPIIVVPAPTPAPEPSPVDIPKTPVVVIPTPAPTPPPVPETVDKEVIIDEFLASLKRAYLDSK